MSKEYYLGHSPYYGEDGIESFWNTFINSLNNLETPYIRIIENLWLDHDYPIERSIFGKQHFEFDWGIKAELYVTNSPFLAKEENTYLCYQYYLEKGIINEMKTEWLDELKESGVTYQFSIYDGETMVFAIDSFRVIGLFGEDDADLKAYQDLGLNFQKLFGPKKIERPKSLNIELSDKEIININAIEIKSMSAGVIIGHNKSNIFGLVSLRIEEAKEKFEKKHKTLQVIEPTMKDEFDYAITMTLHKKTKYKNELRFKDLYLLFFCGTADIYINNLIDIAHKNADWNIVPEYGFDDL